jgi:hypothetical protein
MATASSSFFWVAADYSAIAMSGTPDVAAASSSLDWVAAAQEGHPLERTPGGNAQYRGAGDVVG